jgi:DNA-binding Lrp family transcriptional regulator
MGEWSLITSHGLALAAISRNSQKTTREIGDDVGITERRAHKIIVDLEQVGYIKRTKVGNHNVYTINADVPLESRFSNASLGDLLKLFGWRPQKRTRKPRRQDNV